MKYAIIFLNLFASSALLYAEEAKLMPEVVKLLQDAPKLAQNLRRFDTLCMDVSFEIFLDGKWRLAWSKKIVADFKRDIIKVKEVREKGEFFRTHYRTYHEWSASSESGKRTDLSAELDETENNIFFPQKLKEASVYICPATYLAQGICNEYKSYVGCNFFLFFDSMPPMRWRTPLEIIQDPTYQNSGGVKIKQLDPNTVLVDIGYRQFSIDLSKGMPFKYVDSSDTIKEERTVEVTEFTLKDGRLFPTAILYAENGKPIFRQKVNPKTLKIDQPLSPNDFAVKIYPGTRVRDEIENREYIAKQEMTSADIRELERQIVNLVGEVQKHREKSKNEAKAKKEQQEKEKQ